MKTPKRSSPKLGIPLTGSPLFRADFLHGLAADNRCTLGGRYVDCCCGDRQRRDLVHPSPQPAGFVTQLVKTNSPVNAKTPVRDMHEPGFSIWISLD